MYLFNNLFSLLGVFLALAFFTLVERKIMGYMHLRMGPNKVSLFGLPLPMADAMKLMTKSLIKVSLLKVFMFLLAPAISLSIMIFGWLSFESFTNLTMEPKITVILGFFTLGHFVILFMGWGSFSNYPKIGALRTLAMIWSFEMCFFLLLTLFFYISKNIKILTISELQNNFNFMFLLIPLFLIWMTCVLAESNRTPFDLAEGESEIVSGVNTEYMGGLFSLFFVAEYGMMLLWSWLTSFMFLGNNLIYLKTLMVGIILVWARCSFPRIRTDNFMFQSWILLFSISVLLVSIFIYKND